jgi:hypothetical protein
MGAKQAIRRFFRFHTIDISKRRGTKRGARESREIWGIENSGKGSRE